MRLQKHWYLGLLGLIGFAEIPAMLNAVQGHAPWWELSHALWFLWFLDFIPVADKPKE